MDNDNRISISGNTKENKFSINFSNQEFLNKFLGLYYELLKNDLKNDETGSKILSVEDKKNILNFAKIFYFQISKYIPR